MKLINEMERYLPIPVYPSKELLQLLRKQGKNISRDTELNITRVFDSGDAGGIVCTVLEENKEVVMGNNPSYFTDDGDLPVEMVSWYDVQEFIKKLNEKEGIDKYRLPSEAEWEYAARAGITTRYSFGDSESKLGDYAWYDDNSGDKTHPVGPKKPNPGGLYDMHGNVWEWVQDSWHDGYNGAPTDGSAGEGDGARRIIRSCSWNRHADDARREAGAKKSAAIIMLKRVKTAKNMLKIFTLKCEKRMVFNDAVMPNFLADKEILR